MAIAVAATSLLGGCSSDAIEGKRGELSAQFGPVVFTVDTTGAVNVSVEAEIATPVGTYGVRVVDDLVVPEDTFLVIFRDYRRSPDEVDLTYELGAEQELRAVIDGQISITRDRAVINTTNGQAREVRIVAAATIDDLDPGMFVDRARERWQSQPLSPDERATWVREVANGGRRQLLFMMSTGGLVARPISVAAQDRFLRDLYYILADAGEGGSRYIDAGGFEYWLARLASGEDHVEVAWAFATELDAGYS